MVVEINKEAIVKAEINWITENDEVLNIKAGEKIKVISQNFSEYYFLCEYNGKQFECGDIFEDKDDWDNHSDPNTDIVVEYI